jgi:hypothetical protein
LQIERRRRALRLADARIAQGDLNGVYAMTKLPLMAPHYEKFERETLETMREEYCPPGAGRIFTRKALISHVQFAPLARFFAAKP